MRILMGMMVAAALVAGVRGSQWDEGVRPQWWCRSGGGTPSGISDWYTMDYSDMD